MKIDRLIGILSILLQKDVVTAPYLAERFEVSRRTINRDIDDLCQAGIPIMTRQGIGSLTLPFKPHNTQILYLSLLWAYFFVKFVKIMCASLH